MPRRTTLRILSIFNPADGTMLRTAAKPLSLPELEEIKTQRLIDDILKSMRQAEGIGLAAPQVGKSIRLAVIDRATNAGLADDLVLINPQLSSFSTPKENGEEGCLSIPKVFGLVDRSLSVTVKAFDRHGRAFSMTAHNLLARVIQHEVDHLNGILFIDHHPHFTRGQELLP